MGCWLGWGWGGVNRQLRTNKSSNVTFSPVQGKEENKHKIVSSISLLGKIKSWQSMLAPETIFEILWQCKLTTWEPAGVGALASSPPCRVTSLSSCRSPASVDWRSAAYGLSSSLQRRLASVTGITAIKTSFLI